jgi:retron-type reverse transcriptase
MTPSLAELQFAAKTIDDAALFAALFSSTALEEVFKQKLASTTGKGVDRINGFQFEPRAKAELTVASNKCLSGQYRFAPYLEVLKTKGREKLPRLIGIPTVRDRVVLHQLNKFLAAVFPDRVPKNVASTYVRQLAADISGKDPTTTWICSTDIKTFYDSLQQDRLVSAIRGRVTSASAVQLVSRALVTPTVPRNTRRSRHGDYRPTMGVPQGLAISNILASIYMQDVDDRMRLLGVGYYRYVDDVLMYGPHDLVHKAFRSLRARLVRRGLSLHALGSGKSTIEPLSKPFSYLGYVFHWPVVTVREATIERLLHSIASKFSDYTHNKARRLERFKYLTPERVAEIFLMELNERITGAVSEEKRYGWIAYFNQISDLKLLHRLDHAIEGMFKRLPDFDRKPPVGLHKLARAYFEMKFNPKGGYVRNYDKITSPTEMLVFLVERGRADPKESLNEDQIRKRYEKYLHHILAAMHSDEGVLYG